MEAQRTGEFTEGEKLALAGAAHDAVWKLYRDGFISKSTFTRATGEIRKKADS